MKKLMLIFASLLILVGCKKSSFEAKFDDSPDVRMGKAIAEVKNILSTAPNGWVATTPTGDGGGYGFFMTFDATENVTMFADMNDVTSANSIASYYRIKQDAGVDLVFDTYCYLTWLNDPTPSTFGGNLKTGFKSDVDFIYQRSTTDSIIFLGKRYRQQLTLVKATAAQKASYMAGELKTAIDKLKNYLTANKNPYIEIVSGSATLKLGVTPNLTNTVATGKRLDLTGVLTDGNTVASSGQKIALNLNGADILNGGLVWQGITFVSIRWKDATTLAMYDRTGKEYIIKNSATPLVPLYQLWGSKYNGLYSGYKTIYPGTSTSGAVILNYFHNGLVPPTQPYSFNYGDITFAWNTGGKRLTVNGFSSQNGGSSGWTTVTVYNYTVDASGVFKFTSNSAASGGYVAVPLSKLDTFLLQNRVTFDYYVDGANVYAKMTSVEDPSIVMTFVLR